MKKLLHIFLIWMAFGEIFLCYVFPANITFKYKNRPFLYFTAYFTDLNERIYLKKEISSFPTEISFKNIPAEFKINIALK